MENKNSKIGIASFVLGIISVISCGCACIPQIIGVVLGIVAISDKKHSKKGLAIAGTVMSAISLLLLVFWMIVLLSNSSSDNVSSTDSSSTEITTEIVATTVTTEKAKTEEPTTEEPTTEEPTTEEPTTEQQTEEIGAMHYNELLPFYENESGELYLTLEVEDNGDGTYLLKTTGSVLGEPDEGYSNEFTIQPIDADETYESTDGRFKVLVMGNSIELTDNESSPYMVDGTFVTPGTNTGMAVDEFPFVEENELKEFIRNAYEGQPFSFHGTVTGVYFGNEYIIRANDITFRATDNSNSYNVMKNDNTVIQCYYQGMDNAGQILIDIYYIELTN